MSSLTRTVLAGCVLLVFTTPAQAQLSGVSTGLTVNAPVGEFASVATAGWGIALRTGIGTAEETWSGRASLGFDYFTGKGVYSNVQFVSVGADLVHRSGPSFYQFVGFVQSQSKFVGHPSSSGYAAVRENGNFGFTGGVGMNFKRKMTRLFVEFAATMVLTGASSSTWFPVRAGVRF